MVAIAWATRRQEGQATPAVARAAGSQYRWRLGRRRHWAERERRAASGWQDHLRGRRRVLSQLRAAAPGAALALTVGTLSGSGAITANGGAGNGLGGGGGGGRISIVYNSANAFSGLMTSLRRQRLYRGRRRYNLYQGIQQGMGTGAG